MSTFLAFSFSVLPSAFCQFFSLAVLLSGWQMRKSVPEGQFCPFEKPFLPLFPVDHQAQSSSDHQSRSCACSSPRNVLPFPFNLPLPFPFALPFLLLTWRPLNGLDCQVFSWSSHVHKHDLSSPMYPCSPVTSSMAHCPNLSQACFSTMKYLFMLPPCPFTWSEGFSMELFGAQNNSTNTVFTAFKGISSDIHSLERRDL